MKRLIRKSANEFTYKFSSPIIVNIGDEQSWKAETYPLTTARNYENTIKEAVKDSMSDLGPEGLAQYFRGGLGDVIESIIVTVENCKAITIVKTTEELASDELDEIKEFIMAQFTDGWGEGFEQVTLEEWKDSYESQEWDEDAQEYYNEDIEYTATMSASFYSDKDWNVTLE